MTKLNKLGVKKGTTLASMRMPSLRDKLDAQALEPIKETKKVKTETSKGRTKKLTK